MKRVIQIDGELLQKLKVYCAQNKIKIGATVERLILKLLQGKQDENKKTE